MREKQFYFCIICILMLAFSIFLIAFFPLKRTIPGKACLQNFPFLDTNISQHVKVFDHVALVIVDALRSDFVFEKNQMPFLQKQWKKGLSQNFILRAHPPTVTLPRIKAITSGSIPGFVDVVLNFDSRTLTEDNIVSQAFSNDRKIIFYGDDTWIKLFPDHFHRSEGTTSFFVTDYTEVDDNVTRHLDTELSAPDWDLMILHYLGLDHIGHTVGPHSPLVQPKLLEMDNIIHKIYTALAKQNKRSLIVVCGDHGMSDQGSHGGASDREVLVPAVFLSPSFSKHEPVWRSEREHLQIDLAPTLAVLMGLPIPNNNLGQILLGALQGYTGLEKLETIYINSQQILTMMQENIPTFKRESSYDLYLHAVSLHEQFMNSSQADNSDTEINHILRSYETAIASMATRISASLTTYDLYSMIVAIVILLMCLMVLLLLIDVKNIPIMSTSTVAILLSMVTIFGHVTACTSQSLYSQALCGWNLNSVVLQFVVFVCLQFQLGSIIEHLRQNGLYLNIQFLSDGVLCWLLVLGTAFHSVSFVSSSFVEEEHQTWYFVTMTIFLVAMVTQGQGHIKTYILEQQKKTDRDSYNDTMYDSESINDMDLMKDISSYEQNVNKDEIPFNICQTFEINRDFSDQVMSRRGKALYKCESQNMVNICSSNLELYKLFPWKPVVAITMVMLLGRCLRSINQTGNKWLDIPDTGDWLIRPENNVFLSILVPLSLLCILLIQGTSIHLLSLEIGLLGSGLAGCYGYRVATGTIRSLLNLNDDSATKSKGITEAFLVYCIVLALIILTIVRWSICHFNSIKADTNIVQNSRTKLKIKIIENIQTAWILLMLLLLRPHNTVLVAMVVIQEQLLWRYVTSMTSLPVPYLTLFCWWMGQTVFFQQGNSNSFSTVDVSAGYVGLQEYQPVLVALLLYVSTYAGPIYWLITLVKYVVAQEGVGTKDISKRFPTSYGACIWSLSVERVFTLLLYCILVTVERYHLFVWTVFSPKLLYEGMLTITYLVFCLILTFIM